MHLFIKYWNDEQKQIIKSYTEVILKPISTQIKFYDKERIADQKWKKTHLEAKKHPNEERISISVHFRRRKMNWAIKWKI